MKLWLAVTADEYELPLYVTDTAAEMAAWHGCSRKSIIEMASRQKHRPRDKAHGLSTVLFYSVEINLDEEEEE